MLGAVSFITQTVAHLQDLSSINNLWQTQDYFDSGLYAGKSMIGLAMQSVRLAMYTVEGLPYYT